MIVLFPDHCLSIYFGRCFIQITTFAFHLHDNKTLYGTQKSHLWRQKRKYTFLNARIFLSVNCSGPEVIKLISCSTQLSMKFFLLINI